MLGKGLAAEHQDRMIDPQVSEFADRPTVQRLPKAQPENLASKTVVQQTGFQRHACLQKRRKKKLPGFTVRG
jgi:hypothetical protein